MKKIRISFGSLGGEYSYVPDKLEPRYATPDRPPTRPPDELGKADEALLKELGVAWKKPEEQEDEPEDTQNA